MATHPKEFVDCDCEAEIAGWDEERRLPQVGQTYSCAACDREVYVYKNTDESGNTIRQFRDVTDSMVVSLQFFAVVGDWPDSALSEELTEAGLTRMEAIDYHVVEREGLTQSEWAEKRGASQQSVSENVAKATEKLE